MADMTSKRVLLKSMTEEEKKERRKAQQREYMARRRREDPIFAQRQRELCNNRKKILRQDSEYVAQEREYFKNYQRNIKKEYLEMKELLKTHLTA